MYASPVYEGWCRVSSTSPPLTQRESRQKKEIEFLEQVIQWLVIISASVAVYHIIAVVYWGARTLIPITVLTTVVTALFLLTRIFLERGYLYRAVYSLCAIFLSSILAAVFVEGKAFPTLQIAVFLVAVIALPYLSSHLLRYLLLSCWAVLIATTTIGATSSDFPTPMPLRDIGLISVLTISALSGLLLRLLWQFHHRLTRALNQSKVANNALQQAQASLVAQNEWLSVTLRSISDAIIATDTRGAITFMNPSAEALTGFCHAESIGKPLRQVVRLLNEQTLAAIDPPMMQVSGVIHPVKIADGVVLRARDGTHHHITISMSPIPGREQQAQGMVFVLSDITMHLRAQQALRQSEERFEKVFQSGLIAITITRLRDQRFVDVNERYIRLTGYSRDELIGRTVQEVRGAADDDLRDELLTQLFEHRAVSDIESTLRTRGGDIRDVLISYELIDITGELCVLAFIQDITDRRRTERALRESEDLYRLIGERSTDLIALLDEQGHYVYASPSHGPVLGYHIAQLIGANIFELAHMDDVATFRQRWAQVFQRGAVQIMVRLRSAHSVWRWFEIEVTSVTRDDARAALVVARDITERRDLEAQFHQSQKMESVGRLAGGVAHDFNNLLSAITGYTELALEEMPSGSPLHSDLIEIQRAAGRAAKLSRQLLTFARKQVIEPKILDINDLILDLDKLLRRLLGENIELVTLIAPEPCLVRVDPGQIEQVLINLAVNARDAMPEGGRLMIETAHISLDGLYVSGHIGTTVGPHVLITVTDSGIGMDAKTKQQIFEPFFTTKPPGEGTGLGLATSYGIIKQHEGHITCSSELGVGTMFKIYLPAVAEPYEVIQDATSHATRVSLGTETILLVEDEAAVRDLVARVLRTHGYNVLEASDGNDALRVVETYTEPIDLLLSDVVMPQMGGRALAERLHSIRPSIKVMLMSGYPGDAMSNGEQIMEGIVFLQKPFSVSALVHHVRAVLDT